MLLAVANPAFAAEPASKDNVDLDHEETFIDLSDALRSKQYVHRAILNSLVRDTNRFAVGRFFLTHMMGYNQIYQRGTTEYTKFSTGVQGIGLGYVSEWGHGAELGAELSAVSNIFLGYKYFLRPKDMSVWAVLGVGVGQEIKSMNFGDGPPEAALYTGSQQMFFTSIGFLVPTIDIGFKGEARLNFYGGDRVIFSTGVGLILFL